VADTNFWLDQFERKANWPLTWRLVVDDLLVAAEVLFAGYCEAQSKKLRKKMGVRELFSSRNQVAHIHRRLFFPHRVDEAVLAEFLNEVGVYHVRRITARQRGEREPRKIHSVVSRSRGRNLRGTPGR